MKKKRKPNVAKTLLNNWISALFCAIEIHNKPKIEYRYPNVVIILLNSWELILKSYLYKIKKKKNILNKIVDSDWNERYIWLTKCIKLVFWPNDKNKLYINSIKLLNEYRNIVTHAFSDDLDELIYSIITENILLLWKFIKESFWIDLWDYEENLILLPIWIKKPFNPVDFLSNQSYIEWASQDVKDFINSIRIKWEELKNVWIEDGLLINYNMEIIWKNKVKNADFSINYDSDSDIWFSRDITLRLTNDRSAQPMRPMNLEELRKEFSIEWYFELKKIFKNKFSKDHNIFKSIYSDLKKQENYQILWYQDPQSKKLRFNKNIEIFLIKKFEKIVCS